VSARPSGRLWEVDLARTLAIGMMVAYHLAWDLHQLAPGVGPDPFAVGWRTLQVACGSSFLLVVGISVAISHGRGRAAGLSFGARYRRHARRAAQVGAAALLVSLATRLAVDDDYVRFGILHLIAAAMLIAPLLVGLGRWNVPLGIAIVVAGLLLFEAPRSDVPGLMLLGVRPENGMIDWYPRLPWLGPVLIGLALGLALYPDGRRGDWGRRLPTPRRAAALGAPGRHALPIYLVHQPVLIALVAAVLALAGVQVGGLR
jgi:uncharacterized membrane protein